MEALGINIGYLIMQILAITVLILLLRGMLYEPILNTLDSRKQRIAKGLEDARQAAIARDNAEAEARKIIDEARAEAGRMRQETVTGAEEQTRQIEVEARQQAREIVARAEDEAAERRNQALSDLRSQIAAIAIAAANKVVGEALDERRQHELINDFFAKVPASVANMRGQRAVVTSALPLTESEKAAARRMINAEEVSFRVDSSILGGVIVRVGDQIVDNSVAGQMESMRGSLQ